MLNSAREIFFSAIRVENNFQGLKNGQLVTAKILNLQENGSARIFFNGKTFEGTIAGSVKEGDALNMRVLITEGKILLVPNSEGGIQKLSQNDSLFAQLGLPKNELSSAILSFLMTSETRIDVKTSTRLFEFLKNIKKNKKKAVFLAGLLQNKGLKLDEELFKKVYPLVYGEEFGEEQEDNLSHNFANPDKEQKNNSEDEEILNLINHIANEKLHWIVLPFDKQINELTAKGSVSLLLDTKLKQLRKLVMHCKLGEESWLFSLQDKELKFMQEENETSKILSKKEEKAMEDLLQLSLQENGLSNISVKYESIFKEDRPSSIDLSV